MGIDCVRSGREGRKERVQEPAQLAAVLLLL